MAAPIAIVGQGCVLPGALGAPAFADLVFDRVDAVRADVPEGRTGLGDGPAPRGAGPDAAVSWAGGYVEGFAFDGTGLLLPDAEARDPLVQWALHAAREALVDAGLQPGDAALRRVGALFGNLGFPSARASMRAAHAALVAEGWPAGPAPGHPDDIHGFGLPADLLARGLGLGGPCHTLDAACASALVAIQLAADVLRAGRASFMLAGAVQASDTLFLHVGFSALGAMSPTGRSRPFHRGADGLVPAEGASFLLLQRLDDAQRDGRRILGVIRGIGVSNDGRGRSLLAPSREGQVRALRAAWREAELEASEAQLVECHATGTPTGDRTELDTLSEVFGDARPRLGSLKSQLGHLVTAAGAAGIQKVLVGFAREQLPPTLHADDSIDAVGSGGWSLVDAPAAWAPGARGVRVAAVSAFGFGGNNAHVVLESAPPARPRRVARARGPSMPPLVVVACAARLGDDRGIAALRASGAVPVARTVELGLEGLRFPPNDLAMALPQQALALALAREVQEALPEGPDRARVGLWLGVGADTRVSAWGLRWRMGAVPGLAPALAAAASSAAAPPLRAEHVLGTMPNIPANRVNVQLDVAGVGYVLAGEELSGIHALRAAADALAAQRVDLALVGAIDVDGGLRAPLRGTGDAGVLLAVTTDALARARGWTLLGRLGAPTVEGPPAGFTPVAEAGPAFEGLLAVARALVGTPGTRSVRVRASGGSQAVLDVEALGSASDPAPASAASAPASARFAREVHPVEPPLFGRMAPAPALPPVADVPPVRTGALSSPAPSAPGPDPRRVPPPHADAPLSAAPMPSAPVPAAWAPAPSAPAPSAPTAPPPAGWPAVLLAQGARVADAHRAWVEAMAEAHAAWLRSRGVTAPEARAAQEPLRVRSGHDAARGVAGVGSTPAPDPTVVETPIPSIAPQGALPGPKLDRAMLERIAVGPVSEAFGPAFVPQDAYARVVRMPAPPLLLCDRVLGIDGPALTLGRGTIWTETDVGSPAHAMPGTDAREAWYLHDGRMRGGVFIEAGQADLLLASWQGMDVLHTRGERVYRLLGCELTYRGPLPAAGETLRYDIHLDGHARLGDVRMFFFHYDCRVDDAPRLVVRHGQAGFFTDAELAASGGILWDPAEAAATGAVALDGPVDPPRVTGVPSSLDEAALQAFARRDLVHAFGGGPRGPWARAASHTRSPSVPGGDQLLLHRVTHLDPAGGPWGRGYLRAEWDVRPDSWLFRGHFHGDPCMPGTLMFDGCLHAMSVYMAALGLTLDRDGWRFEPSKDVPFQLRCRGQVIPSSRLLAYELFVQELVAGDLARGVRPRLRAQVLCTVDGLKCFHADPLEIELVPDWPGPPAGASGAEPRVLAAALGRPSEAFGAAMVRFDAGMPLPRLPGPPYLCVSRIVEDAPGAAGTMRAGARVVTEFDVRAEDWHVVDGGHGAVPWAVVLEAALQPCGWLASHVGCAAAADGPVLFRNLDGEGTLRTPVRPGAPLRVSVHHRTLSRSAGMTLVGFDIEAAQGGVPVLALSTTFGFFPPEAFDAPAGVGSTEDERAAISAPPGVQVQLRGRGAHRGLVLPRGRMALLDRVVAIEPHGGAAGLGRWRAEVDVDPGAWFFRAHFFQDPVQPGSLGLEALLQLGQFAMADAGLGEMHAGARFVTMVGGPHRWRYRGQVRPEHRRVQLELEATGRSADPAGETWIFDGHLWVDGLRIYSAWGLRVRVEGGARLPAVEAPPSSWRPVAAGPSGEALPVRAGGAEAPPRVSPRYFLVEDDEERTDAAVPLEHTVPRTETPWADFTAPEVDPPAEANHGGAPATLPPAWPFAPREPGDAAARTVLAARFGVAPDLVQLHGADGWLARKPLRVVGVTGDPPRAARPRVELAPVTRWWRDWLGAEEWLGEGVMVAFLRSFVADLVLHDPAGLAALRGRPVLFVANHQNYLESALLTCLLAPVLDQPVRTVGKAAHRDAWLGTLVRLFGQYPGARVVERVAWFEPSDRAGLPALAREATDRPLLVHVEGTRQTEPDQAIEKMSSVWVDVALERRLPIVPVAFRGGLTGAGARHEVPPVPQVHHVGAPIGPETLEALPYAERRLAVAAAIDALGRPEAFAEGAVREPARAFREALRTWSPEVLAMAERPPTAGPLRGWLEMLAALVRV
jgi:3-oxoacyl-(acyl-carrier-protein) synthase/3-hydroxymyristoyl/3-hydroxydecanoyl-(acyl carrier protein) dehydratase/1-acyl-sn-glycerol-3-phosphate acyltransferase